MAIITLSEHCGHRSVINALDEQVALSTIIVELVPVPDDPGEVVEGWRPGRVFREARSDLANSLKSIADFGIYFTVAVLPMLLLLAALIAVAYWVIRTLRRIAKGDEG